MSWHILVMAQHGDLFSVMAGWNIGQRRLYGALLNKLHVDIVWRQCVGELRSSRRYTSRIGKARISGYVLKNADTIAICITSVKLGDGDGWHPGGGSRKPDITQVEPISQAHLTQHGRLWRLAHVSGEEIAPPGPVNETVIVDNHNLARTPRRLPERVQLQLSESRSAATSYLPALFISYRHPNNFKIAPLELHLELEWNKLARSHLAIIKVSNTSEGDHPAITVATHNPSGASDTVSLAGAINRTLNTVLRGQKSLVSSLQSIAVRKNTFTHSLLQTYTALQTSATSDSACTAAAEHALTDIKSRLLEQKLSQRTSRTKTNEMQNVNSTWDCRNNLLQ